MSEKQKNDIGFFRALAPPGRSRESTIELDAEGVFWHDGAKVEHAKLAEAMHTWVRRHPDDGRYILSNGYDWTYFRVADAPFVVRAIRPQGDAIELLLSDGTAETWHPETSRIGANGAIYATAKSSAEGGPFEAKFTRHAQTSLAPYLEECDGEVAIRLGGTRKVIKNDTVTVRK